MEVIDSTESLSSRTGKRITARIVKENQNIYLIKEAGDGVEEKGLLERNEWFFNRSRSSIPEKQVPLNHICLYITSKCNLKCPVCFEDQSPIGKDLSFDEIKKLIKTHEGKTIVLGGREPTCRADLFEIIRLVSKKSKVVLTTNGLKLAEKGYADRLKEAGLGRVAFSFNGFNDRIYEEMNGRPLLQTKLQALENLKKVGLPTTLSITIARGVNDDQLGDMVRYCMKNRTFIDQLRIRSMTEIGRYIEGGRQFTLSELTELLANSLNATLNDFINERILLEYARELFGIKIQAAQICSIKFHIRDKQDPRPVAFEIQPDAIHRSRFKRAAVLRQMIKCFGFRQIIQYAPFIHNFFKSILPSSVLSVEIRSWPNIYTIDLKENLKCPTGIYRNGKLEPLCFSNIRRELETK